MPLQPEAFLEIEYRNPRFPHLGIESFCLSELRQRASRSHFERVQRLHFHTLMLYTAGQGVHELDFTRIAGRPGRAIHVFPGQVQRWTDLLQAEARVILFTPEFLLPQLPYSMSGFEEFRLDQARWAAPLQLQGQPLDLILKGFEALDLEYRLTRGDKASEAILRHQLSALLLQLDREAISQSPPAVAPSAQAETFRRFRAAVEQHFTASRTVEDYARAIGCSSKTLIRACLQLTAQPPKQYIAARVALEAKRLLAHSSLPISEIAVQLGFSEATNFSKFFRRETGLQPACFRASIQAPAAEQAKDTSPS